MAGTSSIPDLLPFRDTTRMGNCMIKQMLGRQIVLYDPKKADNSFPGRASRIVFAGANETGANNVVASIESIGIDKATPNGKIEFKVNTGASNETVMSIDGGSRGCVKLASAIDIGTVGGQDGEYRINGTSVLSQNQLKLQGTAELQLGNVWRFIVDGPNLRIQYQKLDESGNVTQPWTDAGIFRPDIPAPASG